MNNMGVKCIICGNIKAGSDEHIIPKSLGNEILRMNNVCKKCNEGLGRHVDEHLVNNFLSQMIRQQLNLKGQSGKIPNPFKTGRDSEGRVIHIDYEFKPSLPLRLEQNGDEITILGGNEQQVVKALESKLKRMGKTNEDIQELLNKTEKKVEVYKPKVNYKVELHLDKLFLGALKIAYEYMYQTFEEQFYKDEIAQEIRQVLYEATKGNFDRKYSEMGFMPDDIKSNFMEFKNIWPNSHILFLSKDVANQLFFYISLFCNDFLSFSICVSKDASKYNLNKNSLIIIDIDKQEKINL